MTEHRLAHILRAIADGVPVQGKWDGDDDWWDYEPDVDSFYVRDGFSWRIKPKPKVKKWRWAVAYTNGPNGPAAMLVTGTYFATAEEFNSKHRGLVAVQKIDSTMIEVDAD